MPLAQDLLDKLVCPKSKQPLVYFEADEVLLCPASRLRYRIEDGVPVLLVDEATEVSPDELERMLAKAKELGLPGV
jgi:uncharacterized protein YbaR (Trm112 family)